MMNNDFLNEGIKKIHELDKEIMRLNYQEDFKKEMRTNILDWLRIGAIVISMLMAGVGYISYEAGLYKPIPTQGEGK